jgi:hypothetical protein
VALRTLVGAVLALALLAAGRPAEAQSELAHGDLRVVRAGRGKIDLDTGQAGFGFRGWEFLPADESDGMDPANELVTIGVADEKFLIPVGAIKASKNGRRWTYRSKTTRGVQRLKLALTSAGTYKVTLKVAGVDLSTLVITDPPVCLSFAVIIGNDDGFTGVSFDRPKPFPSKLLTLPGFCVETTDWPWL